MKWIYRYLRADRVEIDQGPFDTKGEAEEARQTHASFGAMVMNSVIEVPEDYELFQDEPA